jgi:hypothetical protein
MTKRIMVAAVFLVGCAVGGGAGAFVVPQATAQQAATLTKWEYTCFAGNSGKEIIAHSNQLGAQGWEMAAADGSTADTKWCFKRSKM